MRQAGHVIRLGEMNKPSYIILAKKKKNEYTRTLGRPRRRWEDNIKTYHEQIGCGLDSSGSG
jgi:hypothetical protein